MEVEGVSAYMHPWTVGPGVAAALERAGDEARGDEVELRPGWTITPGRERAYLWSEASDEVYAVPKA